jgi:uncharacterized membrane protein
MALMPMTTAGAEPLHVRVDVRRISVADVFDALRHGVVDFSAMPSHAVFLALIYPVVGLVLARATLGYGVLPMLFPLATGFALLGPFAALALYEMSRRQEEGHATTWRQAFSFVHSPAFGSIIALGVLLVVIFLVWLACANAIYVSYFGFAPAASIPDFVNQVLFTDEGRQLILVGNLVGFLFALLVLMISAVSFPLILDRHVTAVAAISASVRAFIANPVPMAVWGLIVAIGLAVGSIPFFVGLAVVIPILGHATWHLYRKIVHD